MSYFRNISDLAVGFSMTAIFATAVFLSFPVMADEAEHVTEAIDGPLQGKEISQSLSLLQSKEDLERFLKSVPDELSPLGVLSDSGQQMFVESIVFSDEGRVASFRYDVLESELTPSEIFRVMSLFGMQEFAKNMANARVESQMDLELLERGALGGNKAEISASNEINVCGEYVHGECAGQGQCRVLAGFCCHPPSCPPDNGGNPPTQPD